MSTNIKVAVRVRNLPSWHGRDGAKDGDEYNRPIVTCDQTDAKTNINTHLTIGGPESNTEAKDFSYDFIFAPENGQEFLYDNLVAPLIEKCENGYNGCIFVYGQTASGKTYTMGGPAVSKESDRGVILRVAKQLCQYIEKNGRKDLGKAGFDYIVTGSYLEIYNEQLKDLLGPENAKDELKIRLDPTSVTGKGVYVAGLTQVHLQSEQDYINAIEAGVAKRRVAETNMNAVSSRSHAILTLTLTQREFLEGGKEGVKKSSKIHLIDLAGSERAASTGATGATLKEGAAINQSLSCLGNVINALSTGSNHVPYRDSKLTHLLSDSLGGNSLTILIACLTPIAGAYEETLSTLRFAERVKKVKNKAVLNVDANTLRIMALEAENNDLKAQMAKCTCGVGAAALGSAAAAEASSGGNQGARKLNKESTVKLMNLLNGNKLAKEKTMPKLQSVKVAPDDGPTSGGNDDQEDQDMHEILQNALNQPSTTDQVMAKSEMKDVQLDQYYHYRNSYYEELGDEELEMTRRTVSCWRVLAVIYLALGIIAGVFAGRYISPVTTSSNSTPTTTSKVATVAGVAPGDSPPPPACDAPTTPGVCTVTTTLFNLHCANSSSSVVITSTKSATATATP